MKIRFRKNDIVMICVIACMIIATSLVKIIGNVGARQSVLFAVIALLTLISSIIVLVIKRYKPDKYICCVLCTLIIMISISMMRIKVDYGTYFNSVVVYFFVLLVIPISYLLKSRLWEFKSFLNTIVFISLLSFLVRFYISIYEKKKGIIVFSNIASEYAMKNWYRNGFLRINPPCFGIIIVPILFYLAVDSHRKYLKLLYYIGIIFVLYYSYRIHAARSVLLYQLVELVLMILTYRKKAEYKFSNICIVIVIISILFYEGIVEKFFASFSRDGEYGISTIVRINSLQYFGELFRTNIWFGTGVLNLEQHYIRINGLLGALSDIGLFYTIVRFGMISVLLYILLFLGGIFSFIHSKGNMRVLILGIVVANALSLINIDIFYPIYAFAVPFSFAIIDYTY